MRGWPPAADHVLTHAGFAEVNPQLEQLTVNPRRAPERVLSAHRTNQVADLLRNGGASGFTPSNLAGPKETKAFPMPADHGCRLDQEETRPPIVPHGAEPSPQDSIGWGELRPLDRALQNTELMAESQDFPLQGGMAPERGGEEREERREDRAQGQSKEERQPPIYQPDRSLREPQSHARKPMSR